MGMPVPTPDRNTTRGSKGSELIHGRRSSDEATATDAAGNEIPRVRGRDGEIAVGDSRPAPRALDSGQGRGKTRGRSSFAGEATATGGVFLLPGPEHEPRTGCTRSRSYHVDGTMALTESQSGFLGRGRVSVQVE